MNLVSTILRDKGYEIHTVGQETPIFEALEIMAEKRIGAVIVMDGQTIIGVFSERDFARKVVQNKQLSLKEPVRELMTSTVFTVSPDLTIDECMALMTNQRIRHLPVMKNGLMVGLISIGDVVKELIEDKDLLIENMEKYILGIGYGE